MNVRTYVRFLSKISNAKYGHERFLYWESKKRNYISHIINNGMVANNHIWNTCLYVHAHAFDV